MSISLIKDTKAPYDRYWNETDQKWTGLLLATKYHEGDTIPVIENGTIVNYFDLVMPTKNNNSKIVYS